MKHRTIRHVYLSYLFISLYSPRRYKSDIALLSQVILSSSSSIPSIWVGRHLKQAAFLPCFSPFLRPLRQSWRSFSGPVMSSKVDNSRVMWRLYAVALSTRQFRFRRHCCIHRISATRGFRRLLYLLLSLECSAGLRREYTFDEKELSLIAQYV
ncbi:hypothetical protein BO94DRAFT_629337 [Aspergillus sclerotioniger CBS 115572]|uniref:Uncharacterized protein n=1 Tax=Aspergillus sclerotioniger CBS 115572 TaxID=1450535 RepID=A0A317UTU9_9EURO|nr:hypothetical protein BO94DRAFT_629337 [Aspergillus sclerotioniger CBS 115572]PWY64789.1 hypothetical protein BO94DRAFT_629337 [Aspergillus sclerotioniger CBS 115572]